MFSTIAEVNLNTIRRNVRAIKEKIGPNVRLMPIVKANAYGHGAVKVTRAALEAGADMFGVARIEEALELRDTGIEAPILIMGSAPAEAAQEIIDRNITATVFDANFAQALSASAALSGKKAKVHIKVDTGMGRIGVHSEAALDFILYVMGFPGLVVEGVFTHFPCADEDDSGFTKRQISDFTRLTKELEHRGVRPTIAHAANSGGIADHPESHLDMVRAGIILYGLYPSKTVARCVDVEPVLTLKTRVAFIKQIEPGMTVSYGRTYRAKRRTSVATIPIGYADGFSRHLSNCGHAIIHGSRVPIIGRVCMDQTMLDVSNVPDVRVGDEVILYGSQGNETISVEDVAALLNTVPHDVLCAIGQRVPRVYIGEERGKSCHLSDDS
ncbi:MAG: alanine racemase [Armatimonadota bacterium]|nr:alanine racemase [Armatimonadota bacterium]